MAMTADIRNCSWVWLLEALWLLSSDPSAGRKAQEAQSDMTRLPGGSREKLGFHAISPGRQSGKST
jgi:hypothetical protein